MILCEKRKLKDGFLGFDYTNRIFWFLSFLSDGAELTV